MFFYRGINKRTPSIKQASGDRAVANSDCCLGIRNLLPEHGKFLFPSGGISTNNKENICLPRVIVDEDAVLFNVIAGSKTRKYLNVATVA